MIDRYIDEEDSDIFGVSYQCPAGEREESCPLKDFDNLSFKERVERINNMTREEIERIINHHRNCTKLKGRRLVK